eukprot:1184718-Prorocentrum_minimum.AAC.5
MSLKRNAIEICNIINLDFPFSSPGGGGCSDLRLGCGGALGEEGGEFCAAFTVQGGHSSALRHAPEAHGGDHGLSGPGARLIGRYNLPINSCKAY